MVQHPIPTTLRHCKCRRFGIASVVVSALQASSSFCAKLMRTGIKVRRRLGLYHIRHVNPPPPCSHPHIGPGNPVANRRSIGTLTVVATPDCDEDRSFAAFAGRLFRVGTAPQSLTPFVEASSLAHRSHAASIGVVGPWTPPLLAAFLDVPSTSLGGSSRSPTC